MGLRCSWRTLASISSGERVVLELVQERTVERKTVVVLWSERKVIALSRVVEIERFAQGIPDTRFAQRADGASLETFQCSLTRQR